MCHMSPSSDQDDQSPESKIVFYKGCYGKYWRKTAHSQLLRDGKRCFMAQNNMCAAHQGAYLEWPGFISEHCARNPLLTCTSAVTAQNLFVHDESAHPAGESEAAGSSRGTMMEWVRKIQV